METLRLYRQNAYERETCAVITDVTQGADALVLVLDQTVFFPAGGGQPCDTGQILDLSTSTAYEVFDVYEDGAQIYHAVRPVEAGAVDAGEAKSCGSLSLEAGHTVRCVLNWKRRFDHMQRHCGEHILSGIFFQEFGGVNRGFHMGENYMTIDINLEENPAYTEITWEMALHAERLANEAVWQNLPVTIRYFEDAAEAAALPLRKKLALENDIAIVCVGNVDNPADCVACCGTHPRTSGQVGLIKIYKLESYKGMTRIFFESGARAMADYDEKHGILTKLCGKFSAGPEDLLEKMEIQEEKNKTVRNELYELKQVVLNEKTDAAARALASMDRDAKLLVQEFFGLKTDDLLRIGRNFEGRIDKLLAIISPKEHTLLLFSDGKKFDCGKLVKENAPIYNGKGGGNASSARAIFSNREYLDTFIDLLEKHLR